MEEKKRTLLAVLVSAVILLAVLYSFGLNLFSDPPDIVVAPPEGAFYLFVKAPEADANAFCERAKKFELLLVAGDDFGGPADGGGTGGGAAAILTAEAIQFLTFFRCFRGKSIVYCRYKMLS